MTRPSLLVRVNGHHSAWPSKFAADGPRDEEVRAHAYQAANTSVSLLVQRDGELLLHLLIDCGLGVVNSLLDLQRAQGINRVDALLLTHPHFDHIAGLDWLLASCARSRVPGQPWPLPVYSTKPCFDAIFRPPRMFHFWRKSVQHHRLRPAQPATIAAAEDVELTITAVPVEHGPTAPGAAILAVEAKVGSTLHRLGFAWDLLRLAPDADPAPFHDRDLLFVDSTTVHPLGQVPDGSVHRNWHLSVEEMLTLTEHWRARRTYLIHYGGSHDDEPAVHECLAPEVTRALTQAELTVLAERLGERFGRDLRVAEQGLLIPNQQAWP